MRRTILIQFSILLAGTLFAWGNFATEVVAWLRVEPCPTGCTVGVVTNPFITPCFGGALFFTAAFICSLMLLRRSGE